MLLGQILIDGEIGRSGNGDEEVVRDAILQVVFILNALQAVLAFRYLILALERSTRASQRRSESEVATVQPNVFRGGGERLGQITIAQAGAKAAAVGEYGGVGLGRPAV